MPMGRMLETSFGFVFQQGHICCHTRGDTNDGNGLAWQCFLLARENYAVLIRGIFYVNMKK